MAVRTKGAVVNDPTVRYRFYYGSDVNPSLDWRIDYNRGRAFHSSKVKRHVADRIHLSLTLTQITAGGITWWRTGQKVLW